jgi:serpin B
MRSLCSLSVALFATLTTAGSAGEGSTMGALPFTTETCTDPDTPGCTYASNSERDEAPHVPDADLQAAVAGNTAFALDLYQQLRPGSGNLFYSPFSISEALAMTYAGARGETAAQMAAALHFTLPAARLHPAFDAIDLALASRGQGSEGQGSGPFRLTIAGALWGQTGYAFSSPFLDVLARDYGAGVHVVDFEHAPGTSRRIINDWVADRTAGEIPDLLPADAIKPQTRLVLTNAVYFSAAWAIPFDATATAPAAFTRADGSVVQVPTMATNRELSYGAGSDYAAVELPYDGQQLAMDLVVPTQGALDAFEASLTPARLASILGGLRSSYVVLTMPRFKVDSSFDLGGELGALGMTDAFSTRADFSGIAAAGGLSITSVVHEALLDVNEAGTKAAAATGVVVGTLSLPQPATLHVDHPFLLLIRDLGTGSIVFLGRVDDPSP